MARFKALIEYDGAPFMGWQRQKHGPSVQAVVEDALAQATGSHSLVQASGRTDTGVHAEAMPVHFDVTNPRFDANRLREALNSLMRPNPVACLSVEQVPDDFNARFDCIRRYYRYQIWNRRPDLALGRDRWWHVRGPLDPIAMQDAAQHLLGQHDFTSFRATECQAKSPIKTLDALTVHASGERILIETNARSYLHHQVRNIVGTLVEIGLGRWVPDCIPDILAAKDRHAAGRTAPAHALFFVRADYPGLATPAAQ